MFRKYKRWITAVVALAIVGWLYYFISHDGRVAKDFANKLYDTPLPPETRIIDKGYDYGVLYGGGPWGSGGHPTVVAYIKISSRLSEKELVNYYSTLPELRTINGYEVYFKGYAKRNKRFNEGSRSWYEGTLPAHFNKKRNEKEPIEVIVQVRTTFTSNLGEFARS
ncbi:hypothetical protein U8V72_28080 [Priestia filamentosa]|uniref:hypothetical protein n=1 Tax=Priestia filamentosa TaxID=1402861 RepID=UPI00397CC87B